MTSPFAAALIHGPLRTGTALGHGFVRFGNDVLAVTPPGAPRMPNGVEAELQLALGENVTVGGGRLRTATAEVVAGPLWDPRPCTRADLVLQPPPRRDLEALVGRGPGLTPLGDDILIGYLAGATLAGENVTELAERAAHRTTALSGTLLRLAAKGQLPEPAHALVERGDPLPLFRFGATSGIGMALGLFLAVRLDVQAAAAA